MFVYNETELLDVLAAIPTTNHDFGTSYDFVLEDQGLRCEFGFNKDTGDVSLSLRVVGREAKVFSATILGSPGLHVVNEARAKYVVIAASGERLDELPLKNGIRLRPRPLRVELICG